MHRVYEIPIPPELIPAMPEPGYRKDWARFNQELRDLRDNIAGQLTPGMDPHSYRHCLTPATDDSAIRLRISLPENFQQAIESLKQTGVSYAGLEPDQPENDGNTLTLPFTPPPRAAGLGLLSAERLRQKHQLRKAVAARWRQQEPELPAESPRAGTLDDGAGRKRQRSGNRHLGLKPATSTRR